MFGTVCKGHRCFLGFVLSSWSSPSRPARKKGVRRRRAAPPRIIVNSLPPPPVCRAAVLVIIRSAAASVRRRRLWYSTPVSRRHCAALPSAILTGPPLLLRSPPNLTDLGVLPPPCRAAEHYFYSIAAAPSQLFCCTPTPRALLIILVLPLLLPLCVICNPCCLATLIGRNTWNYICCLQLAWSRQWRLNPERCPTWKFPYYWGSFTTIQNGQSLFSFVEHRVDAKIFNALWKFGATSESVRFNYEKSCFLNSTAEFYLCISCTEAIDSSIWLVFSFGFPTQSKAGRAESLKNSVE